MLLTQALQWLSFLYLLLFRFKAIVFGRDLTSGSLKFL